ncbi:MAG: alanine racemase [Parcubacteria group bacterium]|nr:alanine racemase [Parcubacteria group bacterium]
MSGAVDHLSWIEINRAAVRANFFSFRKLVDKKVAIMAVIKSNAYGHGMIECGKIFKKAGAEYLGVASLDEAIEARRSIKDIPISVLSYWQNDKQKVFWAVKNKIELPVYTFEQMRFLSSLKTPINAHLKIDTGTSRVGILFHQLADACDTVARAKNIVIKGVFTHFANSESIDQSYTNIQNDRFIKAVALLRGCKIMPRYTHAACTASTIMNPSTHHTMVRLGIGLYGMWPSLETRQYAEHKKLAIRLQPVLAWKTKIIQIKTIPKGSYIGYDLTYQAHREARIAVLPIGYYDGYDRKLSNCGEVLVRGKSYSIRGRVCMNMCMAEVDDECKEGDEAVLLGMQKNKEIAAEDIARKVGTINYEITTRIANHLPRIFV